MTSQGRSRPDATAQTAGEPLRPDDPDEVGPHRTLRCLGRGRRGTTYLASGTEGLVAVRLLDPAWIEAAGGAAGLLRSLTTVRRLPSGGGVAAVSDAVLTGDGALTGGQRYVVGPFVPGASLAELVAAGGPLAPEALSGVARATAVALRTLHEAGLAHGGVHPRRLRSGPEGWQLLGAGLQPAASQRSGSAGGAPPRPGGPALPQRSASTRAAQQDDVAAWAATVGYAATGDVAFLRGDGRVGPADVDELLRRSLADSLPDGLAEPVLACLATDPAARPTAGRLLDRLDGVPARAPDGAPARTSRARTSPARTDPPPLSTPAPSTPALSLPQQGRLPQRGRLPRQVPLPAPAGTASPDTVPRGLPALVGTGAVSAPAPAKAPAPGADADADPGPGRHGRRPARPARPAWRARGGSAPQRMVRRAVRLAAVAGVVGGVALALGAVHAAGSPAGDRTGLGIGRAVEPAGTAGGAGGVGGGDRRDALPLSAAAGARGRGACTTTFAIVQTWPGGFKAEITVSAVGAPVNGWQVSWVLPPAQTVRQSWNVILATQGGRVEARNLDYNGAVRPGSATTFGLVAAGPGTSPAGTLTCRALA